MAFALAFALGCASRVPPAPYPHESLLTLVGELKISTRQDPWRWPPARDLDGRNIYRVTLARLDSIRDGADPQYRDILSFGRGECLERLGEWGDAREAFADASQTSSSLAAEAHRRADLDGRMAGLTDRGKFAPNLVGYLNDLDVLTQRLTDWLQEKPAQPYESFVRRELERAREEKAELLFANRHVLKDAAGRALAEAQALVEANRASYRVGEHWLLLGSFYETLAQDWSAEHRPEGRQFDPGGVWSGWVGRARQAYTEVAQADGDPAKLEGQARLRALDAYSLRIKNVAQ